MLKLSIKAIAFICLLFCCINCRYITDNEESIKLNILQPKSVAFKNFLGINGFEWDLLTDNIADKEKIKNIQSFGGFRHYMDWERIEDRQGEYTFNPTHSGGFNYDTVYQICHDNDVLVLTCLKNTPPWLLNTYPKDQRDGDDLPLIFGTNRSDPASYILQAKAAFQFAARYGNNRTVNASLVNVDKTPRWKNDAINTTKIGLNYVAYIECGNEVDKSWKGKKAQQSPEEYAANLSAFYDGHMGKLGKDVGVKAADPEMKVVISGLSNPDPDFVIGLVEWCKKNRGYKNDGSVNLCFDIINYHFYNNDATPGKDNYTVGKAPELTIAAKIADDFVAMSAKYAKGADVWITESGYDINSDSRQRAIPIGNKSILITQADWILRSAFLYARHGLKKSFFYMLDDVDKKSAISYSSCGFVNGVKKRPVADYFLQTKKLLGSYSYEQTIASDPIVDVYTMKNKKMYVLYVPDQVDRRTIFELNLPGATLAKVYHLQPGSDDLRTETIAFKHGKLKLEITETPIFVEKIN